MPKVSKVLVFEGIKNAFSWLFSIVFTGLCGAYIYIFREYHLAVEKHQKLTVLFSNP
jgi:hypothetical protein